jgi:isoleucyl-tRNA synthetase
MSNENNYMIWHFLKKCYENGWIYKGKDCVPWCPRCETAISQHEMLTEDYKELTHESVFIKFPITSKGFEKTSFLVWTTTPWTIPANVAIAVNVKYTYGIWKNKKTGEKTIFIAKDKDGIIPKRLQKQKELSVSDYMFNGIEDEFELEREIKGNELVSLNYVGPFDDLEIVKNAREEGSKTFHTVIDGSEVVASEEGTGLLHVAPGAGKEDFELSKKEKLSVISPIGDDAVYTAGMGEFSGQNAKKHPEIIIDYLKNKDSGKFLFKTMHYTHRYPACWRCKTELVWRITNEWYIAMDIKGRSKTLREQMIEVAKKIKWYPEFGLERELDWLTNMSDWLISKKNRYWGLALPIYECQACGNFEVLGGEDELRERAVEGWEKFKGHTPHKPYIDEVKIKCSKCGRKVSRIDDVGNAWLDAGIVSFSTYVDPKSKKVSYLTDKEYWEKWFPADFITESFPGQFKNWFYSMIAMSTVLEDEAPFKFVLGFGTMLGEDGRPMHKSWGNSVEFNEGAEKIGVDVMRWAFATQNPEQNLLFGYKKADETRRKFHLMLWNIYNFFVGYAIADGFTIDIKASGKISENILDKWILSRLNSLILNVSEDLRKFNAQKASVSIEEFVSDLSLWYVRRSRDRIGVSAEELTDKNNCYNTLYEVLVKLSKLLAPFTPFLAEEIYKNLTGEESVHLSDWPEADNDLIDLNLEKEMVLARQIAEAGHAFRKESKIKVRVPFKKLTYSAEIELSSKILGVVMDELNTYKLNFDKKQKDFKVAGNTEVSNLDLEAGEARDIIRKIQEERKNLGTKIDEEVDVCLPDWPKKFEDMIKRKALINKLTKSEQFKVLKNA